jgi:hypothetical protein
MVKWYHKSLPSLRCGFDSRYPLQKLLVSHRPDDTLHAGKILNKSYHGVLGYKCMWTKQSVNQNIAQVLPKRTVVLVHESLYTQKIR